MLRIKELRKRTGISAENLATIISVTQGTISNWENGITEPDIKSIIKLSEFFKVTTDYLLGAQDLDYIGRIKADIDKMENAELREIIKKNSIYYSS
jgi:transcriptional regulator with XRE-family HTH domain